jgi:hypothetical protein
MKVMLTFKLISKCFNSSYSLDYCSHQRSCYYYAESVATLDKKAFPAVKCKSILIFKNCQSTPNAYMGFYVDSSLAEGKYYLDTNGEAPFNQGDNGIVNYF